MGLSLNRQAKNLRGGPNLSLITTPGMVDDGGGNRGLLKALELISLGAINHIVQVNDCEAAADWSESDDGVLDVTASSTDKRVGTNNILLTNTAATNNSQYIETLLIDESAVIAKALDVQQEIVWEDTRYLGMWIHGGTSGDFGTAGEMKIALLGKNGVVSSKVDVPATTGNAHTYFEVDMVAEGWDLTGVRGLRLYGDNANTGEVLHFDDIIRYNVSNGIGPVYGAVLPIVSGVTLNRGELVKWTIDGGNLDAAAGIDGLGYGQFLDKAASAVGTAKRNVFVICPGRNVQIFTAGGAIVAGETLIYSASGKVIGGATGDDEESVGKALEAVAEDGDSFFVDVNSEGTFIT